MKHSLLTIALGTLTLNAIAQDHKKPNIILFMVDDMGWQDTSVPFWKERTHANNIYHTPAMERLAARGVKFSNAYSASVSSPSRTSLMTGVNASTHRVTNWTLQRDQTTDDSGYDKLTLPKWNVNGLQPAKGITKSYSATTLPQVLRRNGYTTIHCGKAHWGSINTPGENPLNLGFDVNIAGHAAGGPASYLGSENFGHDDYGKPKSQFATPGLEKYWGTDTFMSEALTLEAIEAMDKAQLKQKPFYLYMSHYAIHIPLNKDNRFYQKYRDAGLDDNQSRYASLIQGMDKSLGDIMDYLQRKGIADNTIIIFMSDNGGLSLQGRSGAPNTHNYPLNAGKGSAYEGGVRVPMIVSIPGDTVARNCTTSVHLIDFMPSIIEMAGIKKYKTIQKIEGTSFLPLINGGSTKHFHRALYWHFPNKWGGADTNTAGKGYGATSSILGGNWKLIYYYETGKTELFNLKDDIFEIANQANNSRVSHVRLKLAKALSNQLIKTDAQLPKLAGGKWCTYPDGRTYNDKK